MRKYAAWIVLGLGVVGAALYVMFSKPAKPLIAGSTIPTATSWVGTIIGGITRDISTALGGSSSFSTSTSQAGATSGSAGYTASKSAGPSLVDKGDTVEQDTFDSKAFESEGFSDSDVA